tara:strand:+ start:54 stop:1142 length:1089 start_codon:yes stop_codon:yes gene_type:complete
MAILTAEQVAESLYNAGFREPDLSKLVAIGKRESSYKTDAHRTDQPQSKITGDRGLFQINYIHDQRLMDAGIIKTKSDLFDPNINARAAFFLYEQEGLKPWSAGPGGFAEDGDPLYGTDYSKAQTATQNFLDSPKSTNQVSSRENNLPQPVRSTEYDPTYTPPVEDPAAQKGLTNMLSRFGIDYPNAPRATPQLLAFMRGLGMSYDTLEDTQRNTISRVQGRSADSLQAIERSNQLTNRAITGSVQSKNVLSSGAANTRYSDQVENVLSQQSDVARTEAEGIGEAADVLASGQDRLRTEANERILSEEERQATSKALAQETVRDFNSRRDESDYQNNLADLARKEALRAQENYYANNGLGVN